MRVQDVMTRHVETIDRQENAQVAFDSMKLKGIRHLVVKSDSELVGVLSQRDLGVPDQYDFREKHRVAELMTPQVVTASPGMSLQHAANLMRGRTIGCLPVVEEGRRTGSSASSRCPIFSICSGAASTARLRASADSEGSRPARDLEGETNALTVQSATRRSRSAFEITDTELSVIAALAITGDRRSPKNG